VEHNALEVFGELLAVGGSSGLGVAGGEPEGRFGRGEVVALAGDRVAVVVSADQQEGPVVGDEHLVVAVQVLADLLRVLDVLNVVIRGLDFDCAASGRLDQDGTGGGLARELVRGEQAAVRMIGAEAP
jgi:hypothetical protein